MDYRFSGHETFPCRFAWLPKAFGQLERNPTALVDDETAMIALGVGKNMVRAIRFWVGAAGIATPNRDRSFSVTPFGRELLSSDPFLEDAQTLWILHWTIATARDAPLYAWDRLLNRWPQPTFSKGEAVAAFRREAALLGRELSDVTLEQHFDVFLRSYLPSRVAKESTLEDGLDCPLVELKLVERLGRRGSSEGRSEEQFSFRIEDKPEVTPQLFVWFVDSFWSRAHADEQTLQLRDLCVGTGSPGQILKMPETVIRERLSSIEADSLGLYRFRESFAQQSITRSKDRNWPLSRVYGQNKRKTS